MSRLRRAALIAFVTHLVGGLTMLLILSRGLETNPDLQNRLEFLINHRAQWTVGWLAWTASSLAILYFYLTFSDAHRLSSKLPVLLTVIAVVPDLAAQAIEIGVLPELARTAPDLFVALHRVAVMLSGYLANGLYSITAVWLAWLARRAYSNWVFGVGAAVGVIGVAASLAALLNSASGLFWTNAILVPVILIWLAAVALA